MKQIGIAAFGCGDVLAVGNASRIFFNGIPASVLLPSGNFAGGMVAGLEGVQSRVNSGFDWPEEAKVPLDGEGRLHLRRVPVPLVWRKFVETRMERARWRHPEGSTPVCDILAEHIVALMDRWRTDALECGQDMEIAVVIPDYLDESAQSHLIRSLERKLPGIGVRLLWRSVAAAMHWADQLGEGEVREGDRVFIVYAGLDAFERTSLELNIEVAGGRSFIVPLRRRPSGSSLPCSGMDLAFSIASSLPETAPDDVNARWQAMFSFPDIWNFLAGKKESHAPGLWMTKKGMQPWPYAAGNLDLDLGVLTYRPLLTENSATAVSGVETCRQALEQLIPETEDDRCHILYCGPLAELAAAYMPQTAFSRVKSYVGGYLAEGARLYLQRFAENLPTYKDTLPWLKLTYQKLNGELGWYDLVKENASVRGGEEYTGQLEGKFVLKGGQKNLSMRLQMEQASAGSDSPSFRQEDIVFADAPKADVLLDIKVSMRPASGLAAVRIVEHGGNIFLPEDGRLFDFEKMKEINPEEMDTQGGTLEYPEVRHKTVGKRWAFHPRIEALLAFKGQAGKKRLPKFYAALKDVKESFRSIDMPVDPYGNTEDEEHNRQIDQLAELFEEWWPIVRKEENSLAVKDYVVLSTRLKRKTPQSLMQEIRHYIEKYTKTYLDGKKCACDSTFYGCANFGMNELILRAADYFSKREDVLFFFNLGSRYFSIAKEKKEKNEKYLKGWRFKFFEGCRHHLDFFEESREWLDKTTYLYLIDYALFKLKAFNEENKGKAAVKGDWFINASYMFMLALAYRAKEEDFMDPYSKEYGPRCMDIQRELEEARSIYKGCRSTTEWKLKQIRTVIDGINNFLQKKGSMKTLTILDDVAGEDTVEE